MNTPCTAKDIMTTNLIVILNTMPLIEASRILIENKISGAPVIDKNKKLKGTVSLRDIVKKRRASFDENKILHADTPSFFIDPSFYLSESEDEKDEDLVVEDVLTPLTLYVEENTPLKEIGILMVNTGVHRVFVQKNESLVGIISTMDILRYICEKDII